MPDLSRLDAIDDPGPFPNADLDPNHHLTRRGRIWLVRLIACQRERRVHIMRSLRTTDLRLARKRRDEIIATVRSQPGAYVLMNGRRRG
jgi:hypothetical protein